MNSSSRNIAVFPVHRSAALNLVRLAVILSVLCLTAVIALPAAESAVAGQAALADLCGRFNTLNTAVRDRSIDRSQAREQFRQLIEEIGKAYFAAGGAAYTAKDWVFPLKGYGLDAIGGAGGNGYRTDGYDYFAGNGHTGHPSQDIFIRDKRYVSRDDATDMPVTVLSMTGGVVVAAEHDWSPSSPLRGGKYLWIYDPSAPALFYYAHNSRLLVSVGDLVKPGDAIAEVGRTGLNAYKRRSPTHLHLTCLAIVSGLPVPRNIYGELVNSGLK